MKLRLAPLAKIFRSFGGQNFGHLFPRCDITMTSRASGKLVPNRALLFQCFISHHVRRKSLPRLSHYSCSFRFLLVSSESKGSTCVWRRFLSEHLGVRALGKALGPAVTTGFEFWVQAFDRKGRVAQDYAFKVHAGWAKQSRSTRWTKLESSAATHIFERRSVGRR